MRTDLSSCPKPRHPRDLPSFQHKALETALLRKAHGVDSSQRLYDAPNTVSTGFMDLTLRSTRHLPTSTNSPGVLTPLLEATIARLAWEKDALGLSTSPNISDATEQYDILTQLTDEMVKAVETFRSGWDSVCRNPELASDWYTAHALEPLTLATMLDFTKMTADSLGRDGKTSGEDEGFDGVARSRELRYLDRTLSILGRKFPQYLKGERRLLN